MVAGDFVKKVRAEWYFHDADVDQPSLRVTFDPARGTRVMRPVDPAPPGSVPSRVPTLWIPDLRDNLQGNYVDWTSEKCCCLWYEKTDSVLEAATGFEVLKLRDPERPEDAKISSDRVLRTRKDGARFVRPQDLYLWFSDCEEPEPAEYNHTVDLRRGAAARGIRVDIVKAAWWEFWASDSRTETTINYSQSVIWKCYPAP